MTGLGLVTGVTMAAGPAMASVSSDQGTAKSGSSASETRRHGDRVVDVFGSYRACDRAGEYGEDRGYWDDYDCERIRNHGRSGFALVVDYDNWGHGWGGHFPGNWGNQWRPIGGSGFYPGWRPGGFFPGQGRPGGFPGGFPGRPGGFPGGFPGRPPIIVAPGAPFPNTLPGAPQPPAPVSVQS
ncbi:hypothetical protein [Actinoplanes sp. NPDC026619]|uniref:hypothetical protein n=1 Tax=Actinoplanes sp. NPDC026619 TaxID=3155798 RepID=UPI0033C0EED7